MKTTHDLLLAAADELNRTSQAREDNALAHDARRSAQLDWNDGESQLNVLAEIESRIAALTGTDADRAAAATFANFKRKES